MKKIAVYSRHQEHAELIARKLNRNGYRADIFSEDPTKGKRKTDSKLIELAERVGIADVEAYTQEFGNNTDYLHPGQELFVKLEEGEGYDVFICGAKTDVLDMIRERSRNPLIIISSHQRENVNGMGTAEEVVERYNAHDYLMKPTNLPEKCLQILDEILE